MGKPDTFWAVAVLAVCFWAMYTLLSMQVAIDVDRSGIFLLSQKLPIRALMLVFFMGFLAAKYCLSITGEVLLGIIGATLWYLFVDTHPEYTVRSSFAGGLSMFDKVQYEKRTWRMNS